MAKKKQFQIQAADLKKVMDKVGLAISSSPALPITKNILVRVDHKDAYITATDLEMQIRHFMVVESEIVEEFLLPYDLLNKIISLNKGALMTFVFEGKGISIETETDKYKINVLEKVADFVKPLEPAKEGIDSELDFTDVLKMAVKTINKDVNPVKPATQRVLLSFKSGEITIASTDSSYEVFSLTQKSVIKADVELLLPLKLIKALDGIGPYSIRWDEKTFAVLAENIVIITTRPEDKFVQFRAVFPPDFDSNLKFDKKEMLLALEKCSLSKSRFREAVLDLKTGIITATDEGPGIKINIKLSSIDYSGKVEAVRFSFDKMSNLLNQVPYNEIDLAVHDPKRAILFRSAEEPGYLALLMPLA